MLLCKKIFMNTRIKSRNLNCCPLFGLPAHSQFPSSVPSVYTRARITWSTVVSLTWSVSRVASHSPLGMRSPLTGVLTAAGQVRSGSPLHCSLHGRASMIAHLLRARCQNSEMFHHLPKGTRSVAKSEFEQEERGIYILEEWWMLKVNTH